MNAPLPTRRSVLIGGALLATAGIAVAAQPRRIERRDGGRSLDALIPRTVGEWIALDASDVVLPTGEVAEKLYDDVLSRTYVAPGAPAIMLCVAYGGALSPALTVHRPETCYRAAGFEIRDAVPFGWPIVPGLAIPARSMTGVRGQRVERVDYWRRISNGFPDGEGEERLVFLRRAFAGAVPDGLLLRVSNIDDDPGRASRANHAFGAALVAACDPTGRELLIGDIDAARMAATARDRYAPKRGEST